MKARLLVVLGLAVYACGNEVSVPGGAAGTDVPPSDTGGRPGDADTTPPADEGPGDGGGDVLPPDDDPPTDDDPPAGKVPVLVAQGHAGRFMMSCDDGRSWRYDYNDEPDIVCYAPTDCDHRATSAAGLTYANGWFFAAFGHGSPMGSLRRSSDGKTWHQLHVGDSQGGVYFNGTRLVWMNGQFGVSDDLGVTVDDNLENVPGHFYQSRRLAGVDDVIIVSSDDPGGLVSRDGGLTWQTATLTDVRWGRNVFMARAPDDSLVTLSAVHDISEGGQTYRTVAYAARSTDGGLTWNGTQRLDYVTDYIEWSGMFVSGAAQLTAFMDGQLWRSDDGTSWSAAAPITAPVPASWVTSGRIGRSTEGTYVTVTSVWDNYYAKQKALRSTDGVTWTVLDAESFTGGHPVLHIVSGWVDADACAP